EGMEICHNDSNGKNNRLDNLRYDTRTSNQLDRYRTGDKKEDIEMVLEIRRLYKTGNYTQAKLGEMFGMRQGSILRIVNRQRYGWLNDDGTIQESKTEIKYAG